MINHFIKHHPEFSTVFSPMLKNFDTSLAKNFKDTSLEIYYNNIVSNHLVNESTNILISHLENRCVFINKHVGVKKILKCEKASHEGLLSLHGSEDRTGNIKFCTSCQTKVTIKHLIEECNFTEIKNLWNDLNKILHENENIANVTKEINHLCWGAL